MVIHETAVAWVMARRRPGWAPPAKRTPSIHAVINANGDKPSHRRSTQDYRMSRREADVGNTLALLQMQLRSEQWTLRGWLSMMQSCPASPRRTIDARKWLARLGPPLV